MRLERLWLGDYKNLKDLTVDFQGEATTILLGQNGTGKSNLIEALVEIFAALNKGGVPPFDAELRYLCNGHRVELRCRRGSGEQPRLLVDGKRIARTRFKARRNELLPKNVFAYYSGPSNRLRDHFDESQRRFYEALIKDEAGSAPLPLRPLFYAQPEHSQFVLLANDERVSPAVAGIVRDRLGIESIESVLFVLKRPDWSRGRRGSGKDEFWGAVGEPRALADRLRRLAFAPARASTQVRVTFNKPRRRQEQRLLFLPDGDRLRALIDEYEGPRDFFKALESLYISDMLEEVRIRVRRRDGGVMTFTELSEGEQQLLTVLGLIAFTGEDESLFLLDEPDTHINPNWASDYVSLTDEVLAEAAGTHVLMATHDPIIVGEVEREDILLFELEEPGEGGEKPVTVGVPSEAPRGLGVAGVLTGEFFGLATTLDEETQSMLEERYELELRLRAEGELPEPEWERMRELSDALEQLGFTMTVRDPMYSEYLRARAALEDEPEMDRKLGRALARRALAKRAMEAAVEEMQ